MDDKTPGHEMPLPALLNPEALAQTQKLAEIGLMTSAVLHELKQPLAGIKGYAQMLRDRGTGGDDTIEHILAQVARIEGLVATQRRFLNPGTGDRTRVDLKAVAGEAIKLVEPKAKQLNTPIELRAPSHPVATEAVEGHLLQILANLLSNALDAVAGSGGARKPVEVHVRGEAGACEVLVADHGSGVAPTARAKLFTAFFTTKGPETGTGLGLYISRSLAEANGASLEHLSGDAAGLDARTVFRLRFGGARRAETAAHDGRRAVLIVDDEEVVRSLLATLLESEDVELQLAASGDEGLVKVEQQRFDLVISDKNLPGASGLDIARAVRARWPDCPVMLMTGYASLETAQEGLSIGLVDYLEKPFDDIAEVRRRIREALKPRVPATHRADELSRAARRVLVVEDRPADAVKIGEAVNLAGGMPVVVSTIAQALREMSGDGAAGVILSLELKDQALSPEAIRSLGTGANGALVTLCDNLSLEQTISAIRMGAAACLPRALASPLALSRELSRVFGLARRS